MHLNRNTRRFEKTDDMQEIAASEILKHYLIYWVEHIMPVSILHRW